MTEEIYHKWMPIEGVPNRIFCEGVHDNYEGLRILLKGERTDSAVLSILFDSILAYRNTDEGNRLKTIDAIGKPNAFPFCKVQNSKLINWFNEENYGLHDVNEIIHYAIYTSNDCIDVLSEFEPKVEWANHSYSVNKLD